MGDNKVNGIKINCENKVWLEGYCIAKPKLDDTKLIFELCSINTNGDTGKYYTLYQGIEIYGNPAIKVSEWLRQGDLVKVEGKLRGKPDKKIIIIAFHVSPSTSITKDIPIMSLYNQGE